MKERSERNGVGLMSLQRPQSPVLGAGAVFHWYVGHWGEKWPEGHSDSLWACRL